MKNTQIIIDKYKNVAWCLASVIDVLQVPTPASTTSSQMGKHSSSWWQILATHTRI